MATPHSPALHPSAALDRWRRIEALLHAWLEQRRRLLVLLCSIQGLEGFQRPGSILPDPIASKLVEFVKVLQKTLAGFLARSGMLWAGAPKARHCF